MFVIVDANTKQYFARRYGKTGWYTSDPMLARMYVTAAGAERTIAAGGHHVSYPGDRMQVVRALSDYIKT